MKKMWVAPDGEKIVIDLLHKNLDLLGAPGVSSVKQRPAKWIQVIGTGGVAHTTVSDWCQVTISAWAELDGWDDARDIAQRVRAVISEAVESGEVAGVECYGAEYLSTPYANRDPISGFPRVTQTVRLALRGRYEELPSKNESR